MPRISVPHIDCSHQKRCVSCKQKFIPSPRLGNRQQTCGTEVCKKSYRAKSRKAYRVVNPEAETGYRAKREAEYWRRYREEHPDYVKRNRRRSLLVQRIRRAGLQRQLDILQAIEFPSKLEEVVEFATSTRSLFEGEVCKKCG